MDFLSLLAEDSGTDFLYATTIKDALSKRILVFNDEVNDDVVENYIYQIIRWNIEDKDIPTDKRKPIVLLLNSPGGDCIVGFSLVNLINVSKTPVVAIGLGLVASMAFHTFIGCHKRYAFPDTVLLMHDGEITISNSTSKAKDTMRFFDNMEERTKKHVLGHTSMDEEFYDKHYDQEYYMYANEQGKELGCVDGIIGEDIMLDEIF